MMTTMISASVCLCVAGGVTRAGPDSQAALLQPSAVDVHQWVAAGCGAELLTVSAQLCTHDRWTEHTGSITHSGGHQSNYAGNGRYVCGPSYHGYVRCQALNLHSYHSVTQLVF